MVVSTIMDPATQLAFDTLKLDMQQMIASMEEKYRVEIEKDGGQKETMMKKVDYIESLVKNLETQAKNNDGEGGGKGKFKYRDAKDVRPGIWDGNTLFADLSMELRTWARTLHEDFISLIDMAEKDTGEFLTTMNIDEVAFPDFEQIDRYLYNILVVTVKGDAKTYVNNPGESGFQAWAQMTQHYDPRGTVDRTVAYGRLVNPVPHFGQATNVDQARQAIQKWEAEVVQYEKKFKIIDVEAKMLGLKTLMPKEMFGENGVFRGVVHQDYKALRKAILGYICDKPLPSKAPMIKVETIGHVGDKQEDAEADEQYSWDDMVLMMKGKSFGKGKGPWQKGQGKADGGGKGKSKGCFTCGGDHFARDCPNSGKGGYGGGKGGYAADDKICYSCGKPGHIAVNCRSSGKNGWKGNTYGGKDGGKGWGKGKGLNNFEDNEEEVDNESWKGGSFLWCMEDENDIGKIVPRGATKVNFETPNRWKVLEQGDMKAKSKSKSRHVKMQDLIDSEDESEDGGKEQETGSSYFGSSRQDVMTAAKVRTNLGSSSIQICQTSPSDGDDENVSVSNCNNRFLGSGSSHNCGSHFHEKDRKSKNQCFWEEQGDYDFISVDATHKTKTKMPKWMKPKSRPKAAESNEMIGILGEADVHNDQDMIMSFQDKGFTWMKEEAAVDSGAVDCVASKRRFPHMQIMPTPESERGEAWTCAGGKKIPKEGEIELEWFTNEGEKQKTKIKIGDISRTLISADKLLEKGNDVILSKNAPRIVKRNGEVIRLKRKNGMFLMDMWYKVPMKESGFTRQGS